MVRCGLPTEEIISERSFFFSHHFRRDHFGLPAEETAYRPKKHAFVENQKQSTFEAEIDEDHDVLNNNMLHERDSTSPHPPDDNETNSRNEMTDEADPTVTSTNRSANHPRRCQSSGKGKDSNCTSEGNHFPSSVLMIEAHYNQTVRDFLQICTPVERVEIESVDDVQMLLNALFEQMTVKQMSKTSSSLVLLFNLEHYANWTKERVIEVLQSSVNALHNGFKDMMIYSKFHQDGADSNDTHLTLTYDVKYWLSELCNQRLTPCADFASIILESVLQMNEIENEGASNSIASGELDSLEDASSQANA